MPNGIPPTNLPTGPVKKEEPKIEEPLSSVPERQIFPKKATENLPKAAEKDRFGAPQDIVPKKSNVDDAQFLPEDGLSPEEVEKRETIKKVLVFLIIILLVIFAVVLVFYRLKSSRPSAITESPSISIMPTPKVDEKTDTDGDGLPDLWEKKYGLNPNDPKDAIIDSDLDKLTNLEEYKYGTNPSNPDSDGDGYKDGDEVRNGFNPAGPGKLQGNNQANQKDFSTIKGAWEGEMVGAVYQIKDLDLTMQADGNASGSFTTAYGDSKIKNEISGSYNFDKGSKVFNASFSGSANFLGRLKTGPSKVDFSLTFNGNENNGEITGTWILSPKTLGVAWFKNDRGNLKIEKIAGF